jgi:hypothetical protein
VSRSRVSGFGRGRARPHLAWFFAAIGCRSEQRCQEVDGLFGEPFRTFAVQEMPGTGDFSTIGAFGERTDRAAEDFGPDAPVVAAEDDQCRNRKRRDGEPEL